MDNELQSTMHNVFAITERLFLVVNMFLYHFHFTNTCLIVHTVVKTYHKESN